MESSIFSISSFSTKECNWLSQANANSDCQMLWEVIDGKENSLAKRRKVLKANNTQTCNENHHKSLTFDNSPHLYFLFYRYFDYQSDLFNLDPELIGHPQTHSMLCYVMLCYVWIGQTPQVARLTANRIIRHFPCFREEVHQLSITEYVW